MKIKFTTEQPYMLPILNLQYQACWCPGDLSRQGIIRHSIDQIKQNMLTSKELINTDSSKNIFGHTFSGLDISTQFPCWCHTGFFICSWQGLCLWCWCLCFSNHMDTILMGCHIKLNFCIMFAYISRRDHQIYDRLVQDCSISRVLAMEILQSCSKPSLLYIINST